MITIHKPEIIDRDNCSRLQASVEIDSNKIIIWFEVDNKYKEFLCWERADAFVIGLLHYAMTNRHDIVSLSPITEDLHYQINTYLTDALYKGSHKVIHKTKVAAEVISEPIENAGAVGASVSCGIDSLHTISTHSDGIYKKHNITHLSFFNVGANLIGEKAEKLFYQKSLRAQQFCDEFNFELVKVDSNFMDVLIQDNHLVHSYRTIAVVYILQKLFSYYYFSSGTTFMDFSLNNNQKEDPAYYEIFLLDILSTKNLRFYSEGGTLSRLEKTNLVSDYLPSYKYLHVCSDEAHNCMKCEKCVRTILSLNMIGKLDNYKDVFDIDFFLKNKKAFLYTLYKEFCIRNPFYKELYKYYKKDITLLIKVNVILKNRMDITYVRLINNNLGIYILQKYRKYIKKK